MEKESFKRTLIILQRDFKELKQTRPFLVVTIMSAIITIAAVVALSVSMTGLDWLLEESARPLLILIIGLVVYFLPLLIILTFIWAFSSLPVIKEKVNGNIANLLATPVNPREIWIGKSLAIFLPGFAMSFASIFIVLAAVNIIISNHSPGDFFLPAPVLLTGIVLNPLLFFGLVLFIILFSLAGNPDIAIAPSFILGFGLMLGIPLGIATGVIDIASWDFFFWYLGGTAVVLIIVVVLSRFLTKEKIILSGTQN